MEYMLQETCHGIHVSNGTQDCIESENNSTTCINTTSTPLSP